MAYRLIIKEEAVADIQQAYDYYEENKTGLGNHFLDILDDYFEQIQKHPLHFIKSKKITIEKQ